MAYADDFDVTTPSGAEFKSQGDDRIREFKRALSERLATVFIGWPDDDPLKLNHESLDERVSIGYGAALPEPPTDELFFKTDTEQLYIIDQAGDAYELANQFAEEAVITVDTLANIPNPPVTPFFFSTDTNDLYVKEDDGVGGFEYTIASQATSATIKRARISLSVEQLIADLTPSQIEFDTEEIDDGDYYDPASLGSPNEFVIDEAGLYQVTLNVHLRYNLVAEEFQAFNLLIETVEGIAAWPGAIGDIRNASILSVFPWFSNNTAGIQERTYQFVSPIFEVVEGTSKRVRAVYYIEEDGNTSETSIDTDLTWMELVRLGRIAV